MANESFGDMDVNGVVSFNNTVIFGNDNDEVLCYTDEGTQRWRIPTSGDVEHAPVILKTKKQGDILVFATEMGEVRALNPSNGNTIWKHYNEDFEGWKIGDNRTLFKVKMHFTSGMIYFSKPAVVDVNKDGTNDLVYGYKNKIIAISGENGKVLWNHDLPEFLDHFCNNYRQTPNVFLMKGAPVITVTYTNHKTNNIKIIQMNAKGKVITNKNFVYTSWGESLNHTPGFLYVSGMIINLNTLEAQRLPFYSKQKGEKKFRFSGDVQLSRERIQLDGEEAIGVIFQHDTDIKDASMFMLVGLESNKTYLKTVISGGSEFTPVFEDFNQDGKIDLLIGSWNEQLYCYDLNISTNQLIKL
jgi:outer membrane protein assembly factor BamB